MEIQEQEKTYTYEEYLLEYFFGEGDPMEPFGIYLNNFHKKDAQLTEDDWSGYFFEFEEHYVGEMSVIEYAELLAEEIYSEAVKSGYFDYKSFANDLKCGGDVWETDGHLFKE
jgi:hypothetical protein